MERDHIYYIRRDTLEWLRTRFAIREFRLAPDQPWRTGADLARHFDELSDDEARELCDDMLNAIENDRALSGLLTR